MHGVTVYNKAMGCMTVCWPFPNILMGQTLSGEINYSFVNYHTIFMKR